MVVGCDTEYNEETDSHTDHYQPPDISERWVGGTEDYTQDDGGSNDSLLSYTDWREQMADDNPRHPGEIDHHVQEVYDQDDNQPDSDGDVPMGG